MGCGSCFGLNGAQMLSLSTLHLLLGRAPQAVGLPGTAGTHFHLPAGLLNLVPKQAHKKPRPLNTYACAHTHECTLCVLCPGRHG